MTTSLEQLENINERNYRNAQINYIKVELDYLRSCFDSLDRRRPRNAILGELEQIVDKGNALLICNEIPLYSEAGAQQTIANEEDSQRESEVNRDEAVGLLMEAETNLFGFYEQTLEYACENLPFSGSREVLLMLERLSTLVANFYLSSSSIGLPFNGARARIIRKGQGFSQRDLIKGGIFEMSQTTLQRLESGRTKMTSAHALDSCRKYVDWLAENGYDVLENVFGDGEDKKNGL